MPPGRTTRFISPDRLNGVGHKDDHERHHGRIEAVVGEWPILSACWFRDGSEKERLIDRSRFEFLGDMEYHGVALGAHARKILDEVRVHWPNWQLRPAEQAGFHIGSEGSSGIIGDPKKLGGVYLLAAVVGEAPARSVFGLNKALDRLRTHAPRLADTKKFQKLLNAASVH